MRLAQVISSARESSGISPICIRYIRTGSSIATAEPPTSTSDSPSASSASTAAFSSTTSTTSTTSSTSSKSTKPPWLSTAAAGPRSLWEPLAAVRRSVRGLPPAAGARREGFCPTMFLRVACLRAALTNWATPGRDMRLLATHDCLGLRITEMQFRCHTRVRCPLLTRGKARYTNHLGASQIPRGRPAHGRFALQKSNVFRGPVCSKGNIPATNSSRPVCRHVAELFYTDAFYVAEPAAGRPPTAPC